MPRKRTCREGVAKGIGAIPLTILKVSLARIHGSVDSLSDGDEEALLRLLAYLELARRHVDIVAVQRRFDVLFGNVHDVGIEIGSAKSYLFVYQSLAQIAAREKKKHERGGQLATEARDAEQNKHRGTHDSQPSCLHCDAE